VLISESRRDEAPGLTLAGSRGLCCVLRCGRAVHRRTVLQVPNELGCGAARSLDHGMVRAACCVPRCSLVRYVLVRLRGTRHGPRCVLPQCS
jgi:hypothetical protein